jgi:hypothetical protein
VGRILGMPLSAKLLTRAARPGQLVHLRWLRAPGCAWEPCARRQEGPCSSAAEGGHLAVLQWARGDGFPWDAATAVMQPEVGTCLYFSGPVRMAWDAFTCRGAAQGGHLACYSGHVLWC